MSLFFFQQLLICLTGLDISNTVGALPPQRAWIRSSLALVAKLLLNKFTAGRYLELENNSNSNVVGPIKNDSPTIAAP
jgi:hypothetical protein